MVTKIQLFKSSDLPPLDFFFFLWGWMKSEVYKRMVDTKDELVARILESAACIKERAHLLRRITRDLRKRVARGFAVRWDFGTFIVNPKIFLTSNFVHDVNVVFCLLGDSLASEVHMPTYRNDFPVPSS